MFRNLLAGLLLIAAFLYVPNEVMAQRHSHKKKVVVVAKRPAHKVVVRRASVRYAGGPRLGSVVTTIPAGAIVIGTGPRSYHLHRGVYYAYGNNRYVVVRPARGIRIKVLPAGYRTVVIGPRKYYYYFGTYYLHSPAANEYVVVNPPTGAVVDALPEGYEVVTIDGNEYYKVDDIYYAEVDAPEFEEKIGYQVVEL